MSSGGALKAAVCLVSEGCAKRQITPVHSKWFRLQQHTFYTFKRKKKKKKWSRNCQRTTGAGAKNVVFKVSIAFFICFVRLALTVQSWNSTWLFLSTRRMLPSRCFGGISELWQPARPLSKTSTTGTSWMSSKADQLAWPWVVSFYLSVAEASVHRCHRSSAPAIPFEGRVWLTCHCRWTCG